APAQILTSERTVSLYASGFAPDEKIVISLTGSWERMEGVTVVNPPIGGGMANEYGADEIILARFDASVKTYSLEPGMVYTLVAAQGDIEVSTPLVLAEPSS
ncbi:hypothetical protein ACFLXF_05095, partial [Chloroflexota bacterium]